MKRPAFSIWKAGRVVLRPPDWQAGGIARSFHRSKTANDQSVSSKVASEGVPSLMVTLRPERVNDEYFSGIRCLGIG